MLHILLLILKWIALILGGIIGLLLLLLLLVLFVPLRYRMRLVSGEEGITGRIQADWLLRAFGITADYPVSYTHLDVYKRQELIGAGVTSFKIEGRMKRAEYTAGVVHIYRKYMDLYGKAGRAGYRVDPKDMELLEKLYTRSGFSEGYAHQHNGAAMITASKPDYACLLYTSRCV